MGFSAIATAVFGAGIGTGIGATLAGIAVSAVVGAAIGGLAAAVTGGDIGSGMLFGAIGGVVTGGLFGGMIAGPESLLSGGLDLAGGGMGTIGPSGGMVFDSVSGEVLGQVASTTVGTGASGGGSGIFGGALGKIFQGSGGALVTAAGSLFKKEAYDPNKDPDYLDKVRAENAKNAQDLARVQAEAYGGGGSEAQEVPYLELEKMKQEGALNQIALQTENDRKAIQLQGSQNKELQAQEYTLANANAQKEWDRAMGKLKDAAGVAASSTYKSGQENFQAIANAETARGNNQPGRGALMGYQNPQTQPMPMNEYPDGMAGAT